MTAPGAADPEAAYYQGIEEYFVSRRGDPLFLSNADWTLVRKWRQAGLPLRIVLRGIRDALDGHAASWSRQRKVGSLAYCAAEVEAARERWERAIGREGAPQSRTALGAFAEALERVATLGPRAGAVARELAHELRAGQPGAGLAELTSWLGELEARLGEAIRAEEPAPVLARREAEVDASLEPWRKRLPARVMAQIRRDAVMRRMLEAYGLPRLSLFHLDAGGEAEG